MSSVKTQCLPKFKFTTSVESAYPDCPVHFISLTHSSVQFSHSVLSDSLWDLMDCCMPGLPVYHQLPEFAQTLVHWVGDAIQASHSLSSPSPLAFNLSQHQRLFQWVSFVNIGLSGYDQGLHGGSQMVKNPPAMQDTWIRKIPWRKKCLPIPEFLPGKSLGQRSLAAFNPWGHRELDRVTNTS